MRPVSQQVEPAAAFTAQACPRDQAVAKASFEDAYDVEAVSSPSGVTHLTFTRKPPS